MSEIVTHTPQRFPLSGRTIIAVLAAGPLGILTLLLWSILLGIVTTSNYPDVESAQEFLYSLALYALWGAIVGWPATLLGGLPFHAFFYKRGWRLAWPYIPAGALVGAGAGLVFWAALFARWSVTLPSGFALLGAIAGALSGLAFWLIRRPDRDQRPTFSPEAAHV